MLKHLGKLVVRILQASRVIFFSLISDLSCIGKPVRQQPVLLVGAGRVYFKGKVIIGYFPSPQFFSSYAHIEARRSGSIIVIENGVHINNNICIICDHTSIHIGENCRIGHNVEIFDSDFHGLDLHNRSKSLPEFAKPVLIERDVFIGSNVKILKGVTVGKGSVIANGSIVTKNIPAMAIAAGNPAKVVRKLGLANE